MDDYLRAICDVHGVFLAREALDLGLAERTFTRLVRGHHFQRVRHGAYTFPDVWAGLDEPGRHRLRARAAYRTARVPVALSHESAILDHTDGWWDLDLSEVNLTKLDGDSGRREAGRRPH
ncbi:MAG: type IV toxin-antitoxin system AbiEi family antitoxin domain-containing protein, partial [Herbiconiux sp.]|nr:type IV toxin-antitoxin system AbiEi family antitoxin domain-containing protein [Herbiconiux sp.]